MSRKIGHMTDELLTRQQLAEHLGVTEGAVMQMAQRGTGPRFVKISERIVRYRRADVDEWLEQRVVSSTTEAKRRTA